MSRSIPSDGSHEERSSDSSEIRLRTVVVGDESFDRQLRVAEQASGERARHIVVRAGGIVGGEPGLVVSLVTGPDGPDTPPEDIWSDPITLVDLPIATLDSVRERARWAIETSARNGLLRPVIEEIWTFGPHPYRGDPDAITQLLDARLRRVRLGFEGVALTRCTYSERLGELVVAAELAPADARETPIVCELLRQPRPEGDLVLSVADWTTRQAAD